jgi:hypothetical protein
MPFDPISLAISGGGMLFDFLKNQGARQDAAKNQAFQMQNLYDALNQAQSGRSQAVSTAGALRTDQFGNATYYDPNQGRWITSYSPGQEALIKGGVERQGRAQARGAQASSDYDRLRGEYLFQKPKTEAESYAEIIDLINQAQGTGERQLNTLMNRWGTRTAGNLPTLSQMDTGPTPGQQLAETMLKARGSALDESLKRTAGHTSEYLPALKQFEDTANYVAPVDPTGSGILNMQGQGQKDLLSTMTDYDKIISAIYGRGGGDINNAASISQRASTGGPSSSDFLKLAQMMMPTPEKTTGTLGSTRGARYSGSDDEGGSLGGHDRRFNYGGTTKGVGGEAAPFGGASPGAFADAYQMDPFVGGTSGFRSYGSPYNAYDYSASPYGDYATPWRF